MFSDGVGSSALLWLLCDMRMHDSPLEPCDSSDLCSDSEDWDKMNGSEL